MTTVGEGGPVPGPPSVRRVDEFGYERWTTNCVVMPFEYIDAAKAKLADTLEPAVALVLRLVGGNEAAVIITPDQAEALGAKFLQAAAESRADHWE